VAIVACPQKGTSATGLKYRTSSSSPVVPDADQGGLGEPDVVRDGLHRRGVQARGVEDDAGRAAAGGVVAEGGVAEDFGFRSRSNSSG
jgi:hypothetical protein